jgi:hypothetical protein
MSGKGKLIPPMQASHTGKASNGENTPADAMLATQRQRSRVGTAYPAISQVSKRKTQTQEYPPAFKALAAI